MIKLELSREEIRSALRMQAYNSIGNSLAWNTVWIKTEGFLYTYLIDTFYGIRAKANEDANQ